VVEEQVEVEILAVDHDPLLPSHEGEAGSEFENELFDFSEDRGFYVVLTVSVLEAEEIEEVRVAKHQIGRELIRFAQFTEFLGRQLFGLP
jgi:hypothetical protein